MSIVYCILYICVCMFTCFFKFSFALLAASFPFTNIQYWILEMNLGFFLIITYDFDFRLGRSEIGFVIDKVRPTFHGSKVTYGITQINYDRINIY